MSAADEPRSVLAPENAVAWVDGDGHYSGEWAYRWREGQSLADVMVADVPSDLDDQPGLLDHPERIRWVRRDPDWLDEDRVPDVTGCAPLADHMALVAEVDELRERLSWIETRLRGAGAVIAGGDHEE